MSRAKSWALCPNPSFQGTCRGKPRQAPELERVGLVSFSVMVPFLASLPSPHASAFSPSMRLRYARVTMSRFGRSSFFLSPKAPASVRSSPSAFAFAPPLPLASPSVGSPTICHRSGQACGSSWQTPSRNANASMGGWRWLPYFAVAGSFRSAPALCGCLVSHGLLAHSATAARPNPAVEGTSGKRSLPVPRRLRRRAAPHLER